MGLSATISSSYTQLHRGCPLPQDSTPKLPTFGRLTPAYQGGDFSPLSQATPFCYSHHSCFIFIRGWSLTSRELLRRGFLTTGTVWSMFGNWLSATPRRVMLSDTRDATGRSSSQGCVRLPSGSPRGSGMRCRIASAGLLFQRSPRIPPFLSERTTQIFGDQFVYLDWCTQPGSNRRPAASRLCNFRYFVDFTFTFLVLVKVVAVKSLHVPVSRLRSVLPSTQR